MTTSTEVRPFGIDQAVPVTNGSTSGVNTTCTIEGLLTGDNDDGAGPFAPTTSMFALGRPFGLLRPATLTNRDALPFGLRVAVAPVPIKVVDFSRFTYDSEQQIGFTD